ncbi:hypothetical protein B0H38_002742 [Clostridium beijerinckii]|jgi:hypothetical protein|nr:hypothetical protein [Clostridium beijerinckii]
MKKRYALKAVYILEKRFLYTIAIKALLLTSKCIS